MFTLTSPTNRYYNYACVFLEHIKHQKNLMRHHVTNKTQRQQEVKVNGQNDPETSHTWED